MKHVIYIALAGVVAACTEAPNTVATDASTGASASSEAATAPTTTESTTGEPADCVPDGAPIPLEGFAETFAETICAQQEACGCAVDLGCAGVLAQSFQAIADFAAANALDYDAGCAGHVVAALVASRACEPLSEFRSTTECWNQCAIFSGKVPTGGACNAMQAYQFLPYVQICANAADFCDSGAGSCQPMNLTPLYEGDECFTPMDGPLGVCEDGSVCNVLTYKCAAPAGEGQNCSNGVSCVSDLWCDAQFVCQQRQPAGTECAAAMQCESQLCEGKMCEDPIAICKFDDYRDLFFPPVL